MLVSPIYISTISYHANPRNYPRDIIPVHSYGILIHSSLRPTHLLHSPFHQSPPSFRSSKPSLTQKMPYQNPLRPIPVTHPPSDPPAQPSPPSQQPRPTRLAPHSPGPNLPSAPNRPRTQKTGTAQEASHPARFQVSLPFKATRFLGARVWQKTA